MNTQIAEDYVSFKVAKLLKEKGFREITNRYYNAQYDQIRTVSDTFMMDWNDEEHMRSITMPGSVSIPTIQMTMKWLREVHNLSVEVYRTACGYIGCIVAIPSGTDIKFLEDDGDDLPSGQYTTWEKACEAVIKYCLTNLI